MVKEPCSNDGQAPNDDLQDVRQKAKYISELSREIAGIASDINANVLCYLLTMAADEAERLSKLPLSQK